MVHRMRVRPAALATAALVVLFLTLGISSSNAQAPVKASSAEAILDRYVAATGGLAAYDKANNSLSKATLSIPAVGITIDVTVYSARPNKLRSIAQSPMIGTIDRGTDGTTFWEKSTMQGARVLEGEELAEALREAKFEGLVYWRGQYDSVAVAGVDTVDSALCDKIVMKAKGGKARTLFFDRTSGLLVKTENVVPSQMGDITVEAHVGDYRKIGDLLGAFKTTMKVMGQERVMTVTSVEYNAAIPDSIFAVPADVQELLKK
jgi:zinc protease